MRSWNRHSNQHQEMAKSAGRVRLVAELTIKENCSPVVFPGYQVSWDKRGPQPAKEGIVATWEVTWSFGIRVPKYLSGLPANGDKGERRKVIFHCVIITWKLIKTNSPLTTLQVYKGGFHRCWQAWKGMVKREPLYIVGGNVSWSNHYGKQYGGFSQNSKQNYHVIQQSHYYVFTQRIEKYSFKGIHAPQCL